MTNPEPWLDKVARVLQEVCNERGYLIITFDQPIDFTQVDRAVVGVADTVLFEDQFFRITQQTSVEDWIVQHRMVLAKGVSVNDFPDADWEEQARSLYHYRVMTD